MKSLSISTVVMLFAMSVSIPLFAQTTNARSSGFSIDLLDESEVESGCGLFYARNADESIHAHHVFASSYNSVDFVVRINGKTEHLKQVSAWYEPAVEVPKSTRGHRAVLVYANKATRVQLKLTFEKEEINPPSEKESAAATGIMTVTYSGTTKRIKITGFEGC